MDMAAVTITWHREVVQQAFDSELSDSTALGSIDELGKRRIFIQGCLLTVVNAHGGVGGFFPMKKDKILMGRCQMAGNQGKASSRQSKIISFTGCGTEDVIAFIIDRYDMMTAGKDMFQQIGWNIDNLAIGPEIRRGDAFLASLFAFLR